MNTTQLDQDWPAQPYEPRLPAIGEFSLVGVPQLDTVYCCKALELLSSMGNESVDMIATDPPYGCGTQVSAWRSPEERFDEIEGVNEIDPTWLPDAYRVLKDCSAMYVFAKWVNFGDWMKEIEKVGFRVKNCIVWDKMQHGTGDLTGAYGPQHELILFCVKGKHALRGTRPTDVIRFPKVKPQDLTHPYEKPIGLLEHLIRHSTDSNGLVVDPFMGSGSSLVAASKLDRRYCGSDLEIDHVRLAKKKLAVPFTVPMFAA